MGLRVTRIVALKAGTGMLAQVGLKDELLGYLRPDERLLVAPVRWVTPPWSLSFPQRGTEPQHEFLAAASDIGLHTWTYHWNGERFTITDHDLRRYDAVKAWKAGTAQRALGGWRRRSEEVVLLQLSDGADTTFACESRWHAALDQVAALRDGIGAVKVSGAETDSNTAALEDARLLSDELGRLAELFQSGAITADEWTRAKDAYLGSRPQSRAASLNEVERLYGLYRSGTISQDDYERRKLELLSW